MTKAMQRVFAKTSSASFLGVSLLLSVLVSACAPMTQESAESEALLLQRAAEIHQRVLTLDTHVDIRPEYFIPSRNIREDLPVQVTLPGMDTGGLDAAFFIVYVAQGPLTKAGYEDVMQKAMAKFEAIHWLTDELAPDRIELAGSADDVRRIDASGKKVALIGVENAYPLGTDLANLEQFYDLGARYLSLSHTGHSQFADSHSGELQNNWLHGGGLSDLGRQAVAEANRLGIMLDLSHPSRQSNLEVIRLSEAPVIASHSASRTLNPIARNISDEEALALAAKGGVVQVVAFRSYLDSRKQTAYQFRANAWMQAQAELAGVEYHSDFGVVRLMNPDDRFTYLENIRPLKEMLAANIGQLGVPPVDVADLVDHIDYFVDLLGIEHVGIASDFDGGGGVYGWDNASESANVTLELLRRGYSEEEIGMIWSGNLLRVMEANEQVAREIQGRSGL